MDRSTRRSLFGPEPGGDAIARRLLDLRRFVLLIRNLVYVAVPPLLRRLAGRPADARRLGALLRHRIQAMGVTYVKLGQFMAMRFDILPEEMCRELARLFDDVPPIGAREIKSVISAEFQRPLEALFRRFDDRAIAAASIAQVHRAITLDGTEVAVKIQRPGIVAVFAADIRNIRRLARLVDRFELLGPQSLVTAVEEFERYTRREMDFTIEGRTADRMRSNAGPYEHAPQIYWHLTTSRVLTMEFVHGHRLSDIIHAIERYGSTSPGAAPRALDIDRGVRNLANACLRQLFVTGFFHADPHPGNIFLLDDGSVMFIDFGIFCDLLPERRETLASYIENVAIGNFEAGFRHFRRLLIPTEATDHRKLKRDVLAIFRRWHDASVDVDTPLSERHAGRYFGEFITAMRNNRVQMSLDTLLFWRALITLDATALRFRRSFDLLGIMREFFENVRPSPLERIVGAIGDRHLISSFWQSLPAAPANIASLSRQIVEGGFRMPVRDAPQRREKERAKSYALAVALAFVAVSALVLGLAAV